MVPQHRGAPAEPGVAWGTEVDQVGGRLEGWEWVAGGQLPVRTRYLQWSASWLAAREAGRRTERPPRAGGRS